MRSTWILLALCLTLVACYVPSVQGDRSELGGSYVVNGFDPDGIEYGGVLTIEPAERPDEYTLHWVVTGAVQEGHGVLTGDQLEVEWVTLDEFAVSSQGTATYVLDADGVLTGTRTVAGSAGIGTEEAFPDL